MNKRIVYQLSGQPLTVLMPCECGLTIQQIGEKDVPVGVPFWIVDASVIPADRSLRNAWEIDGQSLGNPDGYGAVKE